MRFLAALAVPVTVALVSFGPLGCATSLGSASGSERVMVAGDAPASSSSVSSEVVVTETSAAPVQPGARPRLAQTITLGQGDDGPAYTTSPDRAVAGSSPGVTVNNNVTVVSPPVGYGYGGYGGYGYGGYGYRSGYGGVSGARDGRGAWSSSHTAWAPNGWEGAGRTAAPGRTPGVGGNFAPARSFGPAPMR
jgi:hypothetical protein